MSCVVWDCLEINLPSKINQLTGISAETSSSHSGVGIDSVKAPIGPLDQHFADDGLLYTHDHTILALDTQAGTEMKARDVFIDNTEH